MGRERLTPVPSPTGERFVGDRRALYRALVTSAQPEHHREQILDPALASLEGDELATELMARLEALLTVDVISVMVLEASGRYLIAHVSRGLDESGRRGFRVPVGSGLSGKVVQRREALVADEIDADMIIDPLLLRRGVRSMMGVPMIAHGRVTGALIVGSVEPRSFSEIEIGLLQLAGDRVGAELAAAQQRSESWATTVLQRSLLPSRLPELDGLEFAERFVPGGLELVGGDWYDAFELPSGKVGIVIGDVIGRGLQAAVVMGRLRSVLRAYALIGKDPASTLDLVDEKFAHFEPGQMATIGFAVVDRDLEHVVIATAGHPPPLLVEPGDEAQFVAMPAGPPIGAGLDVARQSVEFALRPGATLMLYTDGLFERRRQPFTESLERLRRTLHEGPVEAALGDVMESMITGDHLDDDTAVLALRHLPNG